MSKLYLLEQVFSYFDQDGDGKISPWELRKSLDLMVGDQLQQQEAEDAVESLDSDGDGFLGLEDLVRLMESGEGEEEEMKDLREAFRMYIDDFEGVTSEFITPKSLKRMLSRLGYKSKSMDECKVMINNFDLNGDGVLSFEEFRVMME